MSKFGQPCFFELRLVPVTYNLLTRSFFFLKACSRYSDSGVQANHKASQPLPLPNQKKKKITTTTTTTLTTKDERRLGKAAKEPFLCHYSPIPLFFSPALFFLYSAFWTPSSGCLNLGEHYTPHKSLSCR